MTSAKTMLELADILSLIRGAYYTEAPDGTDEGIWNAACEHIEEGILALRSPAPSVGVDTRTDIMEVIASGMDDGLDPGQITDNILSVFNPVVTSVGVDVREALDNSQSLLTMIYQLNTNGSVSEHDWETEGLADLITKQIKENRAALTPSQQSGTGEGEPCKCAVMCQDLGQEGGCRYLRPNRTALRRLVDLTWNRVTESEEVPSTNLADELIDRAIIMFAPLPTTDTAEGGN